MLKKARTALKKCIEMFIDFWLKINETSSPKLRKTICAGRIGEKPVPGSIFWAKDRFLPNFWVPARSQNGDRWAPCTFHCFNNFSDFSKKGPDRSPEAPGAPQVPSRDPPGDTQGTTLDPFSIKLFQLFFHWLASFTLHFFSIFLWCFRAPFD